MEVVNEEKHVSCVKLLEFESTCERMSWITYLKSSLKIGLEQGSPIIFEISLLFTLYWPYLRRGLILFTVYCYVSKTSMVLFTVY